MSTVYLGAYSVLRCCRCSQVQPFRQPAIRTSLLILKNHGPLSARLQSLVGRTYSNFTRTQYPLPTKSKPSVSKIFAFTARRMFHTSRAHLKDLIQPEKNVIKDVTKTESKIKQLTSPSSKQEFRRLLGLAKGEKFTLTGTCLI